MESDHLMQHEASTCMQADPAVLSRDNMQDTCTPFASDNNSSFVTEELCRQLRVLVIDGDHVQRQQAEKLLVQCGYAVTSREGIPAASELQSQPSYDLLLIDYPTLSAGDASAVLKSNLPLVLTATSPDPDQVLKGINLGAVDFLEKPLPMLKLKCLWQHKVRRMLSNNGSLGRPCSPKAQWTRSQSQPSLPIPATSPSNRYRLSRQRRAAGAGPSLQQQPPKALQDSSNSEQQQQTSAGSQSGPGGAVMSGAESGSATSTSVKAGTQQVGPAAMDADNCDRTSSSLMLHRLDSSQVAGLTSELSHLFMDDPSLTPRQPGGPLKVVGQDAGQNQFPAMPPRRCQSAMLPEELPPQGTVLGHASGRLPDLPEATGMVWGIPTSPLHISPRPAALQGASPSHGMMPPQLPSGPMPMPMLPMMMPPMMPPMAGLPPDALLAAGQLAGMPPFMMPGQPFQGGLPGLPLPMFHPDMMMMMSGMQPYPGMDSCGHHMSMTTGGPQANSAGMIPTPSPQAQPIPHLPASSSPVGLQPPAARSPPTRSQRRASNSAVANKARRAASMPVPLPAKQSQALVGDSSSAKSLLLDPLAVLGDDPLSGLEPLDPMLLLGVTSLTEDGPMHISHDDDTLPEDHRQGEALMNGIDSDKPVAAVMSEDVDIDVAGVEDWLLVAAGSDSQPLGLTLHKTPSLVDLLMARGLEPTGESSGGIDLNDVDAISCNNMLGGKPDSTAAANELEASNTTSTGSVSRTSSHRRAAAA